MPWRDEAVLVDEKDEADTKSWMDDAVQIKPPVKSGFSATQIAAEKKRVLGIARGAIGEAPFPTIRGGVLAGGARLLSGVARVTGQEERADFWSRYSGALLQAVGERAEEPGRITPPIIKRGLASALATAPTMAITAPLGPYGMIAGGSLDEANNARTEGKDAGLRGKELNLYTARQGAIEGTIAGVMQRMGLGGLEKVVGGKAAISNGIRQTLKQGKTVRGAIKGAVRDFAQEEVEEVATSVLQTLNDKYSGISEKEITLKSLASVAAETTSQVVWTMGGVSAFSVPAQINEGRKAKAEKEIVAAAESGKAPSRKKWSKDWGFPVDKIKSAKDRLRAVQELAGEIQEQREAPGEPVAPEAPATPGENVYHGTSLEAARGISETGFSEIKTKGMASVPVKEFVFVTPDKSGAKWYSEQNERIKIPAIVKAKLKGALYEVEGKVTEFGAMDAYAKKKGLMTEDESILNLPLIANSLKSEGYSGIKFTDSVSGKLAYAVLPELLEVAPEAAPVEPTWKPKGPATTEKGEVADFITGPEGAIGVSLKALSKGVSFVKHVGQRFFTARGELPAEVFKEKVRKDGAISRIQRQIALELKDYSRAVKQEFRKRDLTKEETVAFNAALKGEVPLESLPQDVATEIGIQRNNIDALSSRAIEIGAISGKLEGIVTESKGIYIHRSYRKHDNPKWAEQVPEEVRNRAEAHLRQEYPDKTEPELQGLIEKLLYEGSAAESPIASLKASGLGAKDIRILMKRGDFSPEVRALMGEYNEAEINYAKSMTYLGNLIANHQFLVNVRELGMETFFSETPIVNDYGELKTRIAADESSTMNPLNGLYTTPEVKEAFDRASGKDGGKPAWLRWAMTTNATVKMSKTVGSLMTHVRNWVAGVGFATMQGHWRVGKLYNSYKAIATDIAKKNDPEWRAYTLRLIELGVIGQGVRGSELRAHIRDHANLSEEEFNNTIEQRRARKAKGLVKKVVSGALEITQEAYLKEDDFWKIYGYENELADHRKALPEMPLNELEELAAEKLVNTYPTWSRTSEGVRIMRHLPVGPFVAFPAEIVRTAYHTANYVQQELRDPRLRKIGARRLVGMTMAMAASTAAAKAVSMLAGIGSDDDDDMRWFVAPWQKNSVLMHYGKKDNKAVYRFVDLSYSDPHNTLITPFNALMSGRDLKDGIWNAMKDFAEPYAGEEILHGKIVDVWSNNADGVQVYNPQDSVNKQAQDVTAHLWKAFEPGTLTSGRRIYKGVVGTTSVSGRTYNPWIESIAVITGQRIQDLDVAESLKWRARDFNRNTRQANSILSRTLTRSGHVSEAELRDAYERADTARRGLFRDVSGAAQAAVRLGVPSGDVTTTLVVNGVPKLDIRSVMGGVYNKRRITTSQLRAMKQANPEEYPERHGILVDLLNKDVDF